MIFFMLFIFCSVTFANNIEINKCDPEVVLKVINEIHKNARASKSISDNEKYEAETVERIISDVHEVDYLYKIATICNTLSSPMIAGKEKDCIWFFHAFWAVINKLTKISSAEALIALERIEKTCDLQGADKMLLQEKIYKIKNALR